MAKYKVGDWLTIDGCSDRTKMRVLQIIEDTCSGGTQVTYICRMYAKMSRHTVVGAEDHWMPAISNKGFVEIGKYHEIEVKPYVGD